MKLSLDFDRIWYSHFAENFSKLFWRWLHKRPKAKQTPSSKGEDDNKDEAQRLVGKVQDEEEFEEAEEALSRLAFGFKSLIFGEPLYCYKLASG